MILDGCVVPKKISRCYDSHGAARVGHVLEFACDNIFSIFPTYLDSLHVPASDQEK